MSVRIKWLARKIELIPMTGEPDFYNLSILSFMYEEGERRDMMVSEVEIVPFSGEIAGVEAIDFVPILKEIIPGIYRLEGVPDGPLCGVG